MGSNPLDWCSHGAHTREPLKGACDENHWRFSVPRNLKGGCRGDLWNLTRRRSLIINSAWDWNEHLDGVFTYNTPINQGKSFTVLFGWSGINQLQSRPKVRGLRKYAAKIFQIAFSTHSPVDLIQIEIIYQLISKVTCYRQFCYCC